MSCPRKPWVSQAVMPAARAENDADAHRDQAHGGDAPVPGAAPRPPGALPLPSPAGVWVPRAGDDIRAPKVCHRAVPERAHLRIPRQLTGVSYRQNDLRCGYVPSRAEFSRG